MWITLKVDNTQYVDMYFDEDNNEAILRNFKEWNDKVQKYSAEDIEKLKFALDMLNDYPKKFSVEADIDDVEVDEDTIKEAYEDYFDEDGSYDEGFDDGRDECKKRYKEMENKHTTLLYKLEKLAYNYGNPDPLTQDEIKKIKDILEYLID